MADIHATAIVDPAARLADGARVGPYCVVGPDVELADGVVLHSHVVVEGRTRLGAGCHAHPFAVVGSRPQDMKYDGEESELIVGEGTVIREHATLNPGTRGGGMVTRVGRECLLMIGVHVAHDCRIGDRVIMANNVTLGGHVQIGDDALLGGVVAVHQFVRIGRGAMIGGMSGVEHDVIPYGMALGNRARLSGLNVVGLKRRRTPKDELQKLRSAYQRLFDPNGATFRERVDEVAALYGEVEPVAHLLDFIRSDANRPLCHPQNENAG